MGKQSTRILSVNRRELLQRAGTMGVATFMGNEFSAHAQQGVWISDCDHSSRVFRRPVYGSADEVPIESVEPCSGVILPLPHMG